MNSFVTDDVWIVILVRKEGNGYKQTIRSRVNLIPIRELSRELESEFIIKDDIRSHGKSLDFINTLWNNCKLLNIFVHYILTLVHRFLL